MAKVLELCAGSGAWSQPWVDAGHDVIRVDPITFGGDVFTTEPGDYDVILAGPPCNEFAVSGARWWKGKPKHQLDHALAVAYRCLYIIAESDPTVYALENPVGRLVKYIGPWSWTFDPYEYGDPYTKKTCIWSNQPKPTTSPVEPTEGSKIIDYYGPDKAILRAITPQGFANACFNEWSKLVS